MKKMSFADDDFVLLTNDDNYYCPIFVKSVLAAATRIVGMVYCNMLHNYDSYQKSMIDTDLKINHIDMGAFIVRGKIAQEVGFNSLKFEADGIFAEACRDYCNANGYRIVKLDNILFIHN